MTRPVRSLLVLLALAAAATVTGCTAPHGTPPTSTPASSGQPGSSATASSTEPPTTAPGTTAPGTTTPVGRPVHSLQAGDADQGRTVTMHVGDELTVTLTNTYWRFDEPVPTTVLRTVRPPSVGSLPTPHACPPGAGCGIVTVTYRAVSSGTAVVAANRTVCGEALACTEAQSHYRLTVVVD